MASELFCWVTIRVWHSYLSLLILFCQAIVITKCLILNNHDNCWLFQPISSMALATNQTNIPLHYVQYVVLTMGISIRTSSPGTWRIHASAWLTQTAATCTSGRLCSPPHPSPPVSLNIFFKSCKTTAKTWGNIESEPHFSRAAPPII